MRQPREAITLSKVGIESLNTLTAVIDLGPVVARFRPPNKAELASGGETVVSFDSEDTCNINVCLSLVETNQKELTMEGARWGRRFYIR